MVAYAGNAITDPDQLGYEVNPASFAAGAEEILIDTANRIITLKVVGNLAEDGAVLKAIYSKLKDAWRVNATLIKFPFPLGPITDEQFEIKDGWTWDQVNPNTGGANAGQFTEELIRTAGWARLDGAGEIIQMNAGIISLGTFVDNTDQAYFQQFDADQESENTILTNFVNQRVCILASTGGTDGSVTVSDLTTAGTDTITSTTTDLSVFKAGDQITITGMGADDGAHVVTGTPTSTSLQLTAALTTSTTHAAASIISDKRDYFKLFLRDWGKTFALSQLSDIGVTQMTFQAYRFPLTNSTDLNISEQTRSNVNLGDYLNTNITYLRHTDDTPYFISTQGTGNTWDYNSGGVQYAVAEVVQDTSNSRWYKCIQSYTSDATNPNANTTNWAAYEGERTPDGGTNYYPFNVIVDGDTTVGTQDGGGRTRFQIYERVQYLLTEPFGTDIDSFVETAGATVVGETADELLYFVGSTLNTNPGVWIDSFATADTNDIDFYDMTDNGTAIRFPFVATLRINFGTNLQNDQYAKFWVFFTDDQEADTPAGRDFGTIDAVIVDDNDGTATNPGDDGNMFGDVNPAWPTKREFVDLSYNYDSNPQRGTITNQSTSPNGDAPVTVVGIGLTTGQYVAATTTIERSKANSVTLVSSLERNYSPGTTFP